MPQLMLVHNQMLLFLQGRDYFLVQQHMKPAAFKVLGPAAKSLPLKISSLHQSGHCAQTMLLLRRRQLTSSSPPPAATRPEMVLNLFDGLVPGLRHKDEGEYGPGGTDGTVEPKGAAQTDNLDQVHKGLGHQEAGDEGKTDDEGVGDGSHLEHKFNLSKYLL